MSVRKPHKQPHERVDNGKVRLSRHAPLAAALISLGLAGCSPLSVLDRGDSGPSQPVNVSHIPDAVPKAEPRSRIGNNTYKVRGHRYYVLPSSRGYVERGTASWYGNKFHGRRTSSGERYDMYAMSAAHRTLPLPSYVKVTNLQNGRSVVVRVNDRGPFHDNRLIDLSYTAAAKLGMLKTGTAAVEVRAIDPRQPQPKTNTQPAPATSVQAAADLDGPFNPPKAKPTTAAKVTPSATFTRPAPRPSSVEPGLFLQVGSFGSRFNAEQFRRRLANSVSESIRIKPSSDQQLYRVQVGPLASVERVDHISATLTDLGVRNMRIVLD